MQSAVLGRWFKDGQVIYRQGELGDCLYVLGKGRVELMRRDGSVELCLRVLNEGDMWGEGGLLHRDHQRTTTARAIGDVCVMTIDKRMFLDRVHEDPSFVLKIMRQMSRRIGELEDALVRNAGPVTIELPVVPQGATAK
jgi:CRP-like cAMP-binding protein